LVNSASKQALMLNGLFKGLLLGASFGDHWLALETLKYNAPQCSVGDKNCYNEDKYKFNYIWLQKEKATKKIDLK